LVVMRERALSLLMRPMSCPLALGIVVAVALIVAEMLVVYPLGQVPSEISLGVAYLVVSTVWGLEVIGGGERRAAFALRDDATRLGALLVRAGLLQVTGRRVRKRSLGRCKRDLPAARKREGMGSAGER
jgi:hypothetical protein